ncbi:GNAT family N-acetyltransferase [Desulfosarcina ovata]|nr:GNAT family N-acetyltransferase [Desulfosarcina ovata]
MNIYFKIITDLDLLLKYSDAWNKIIEEDEYASIALTPEWFECWWQANQLGPKKSKLHVLILFDRAKVIAIFLLQISKCTFRGVPITKLHSCTDGITPHFDFIISKGYKAFAIDILLYYISKCKRSWDIAIFDKFRDNDKRNLFIEKIGEYKCFKCGKESSLVTPVIRIENGWDKFWKLKSKKFKKSLRNKINRINKAEKITYEQVEKIENAKLSLEQIFNVSSCSWKGECCRSIVDNPIERNFYERISKIGFKKGWSKIWVLNYDNIPIAYEYHLVYKNVAYPLRADYDEAYRNLSPGSFLEYSIIKNLFDSKKIKLYYSCGHCYQYLMNWTDETEKLQQILLFNSNFLSNILYLFEFLLLPILRKNKQFMLLKNIIRGKFNGN